MPGIIPFCGKYIKKLNICNKKVNKVIEKEKKEVQEIRLQI